jgi:hypothetical protein
LALGLGERLKPELQMGRFTNAAREGLDAFARSQQTEVDLQEILREASEDLSVVFRADLKLSVSKKTKVVEGLQNPFSKMMGQLPPKNQIEYFALEASARMGSVVLAEVELGEVGYPVSIRWPEHYVSAADKDSLATSIETLLRSRHAGEHLEGLAKLFRGA